MGIDGGGAPHPGGGGGGGKDAMMVVVDGGVRPPSLDVSFAQSRVKDHVEDHQPSRCGISASSQDRRSSSRYVDSGRGEWMMETEHQHLMILCCRSCSFRCEL